MIYYNKMYIIKCNMDDLDDKQNSGYNTENVKSQDGMKMHGPASMVQTRANTSNPNYLSELSYSQIMEFYITSKDNSELKNYLLQKKQSGALSQEEEKYWNELMELGLVERVCRTAIMEAHPEDRAEDPLEVKIARIALRGRDILSYIEHSQTESQLQWQIKPEHLVYFATAIKEVIAQRIIGNKSDISEIIESKEKEILEQSKKIEEKMKSAGEKYEVYKATLTHSKKQQQIENDIFGGFSLTVSRYYDEHIGKYVDRYKTAKEIGKTEKLDEQFRLSKQTKGSLIKDIISGSLKEGVTHSDCENLNDNSSRLTSIDNEPKVNELE